jgi:hypothetical protein
MSEPSYPSMRSTTVCTAWYHYSVSYPQHSTVLPQPSIHTHVFLLIGGFGWEIKVVVDEMDTFLVDSNLTSVIPSTEWGKQTATTDTLTSCVLSCWAESVCLNNKKKKPSILQTSHTNADVERHAYTHTHIHKATFSKLYKSADRYTLSDYKLQWNHSFVS